MGNHIVVDGKSIRIRRSIVLSADERNRLGCNGAVEVQRSVEWPLLGGEVFFDRATVSDGGSDGPDGRPFLNVPYRRESDEEQKTISIYCPWGYASSTRRIGVGRGAATVAGVVLHRTAAANWVWIIRLALVE